MPRVDFVRYFVTRADNSNPEAWKSEEGTTLAEVLNDELCINPNKFSVYVNGVPLTNFDCPVAEGDKIELQPKNYNSGC